MRTEEPLLGAIIYAQPRTVFRVRVVVELSNEKWRRGILIISSKRRYTEYAGRNLGISVAIFGHFELPRPCPPRRIHCYIDA